MQNTKDKRKLVPAIMGAVITYFQTEQQTLSVVHDVKPQPKAGQGKTAEGRSNKRQRD